MIAWSMVAVGLALAVSVSASPSITTEQLNVIVDLPSAAHRVSVRFPKADGSGLAEPVPLVTKVRPWPLDGDRTRRRRAIP
jgi:hypothetical protein